MKPNPASGAINARIIELRRADKSIRQIADELGISPESAWTRLGYIARKHPELKPSPPQKEGEAQSARDQKEAVDPRYRYARRKCLSCGEEFLSEWIGNRRCPRCERAS